MTQPTRRSFLTGMLILAAAPAIIRASSLMPVKSLVPFVFKTEPLYEICLKDGFKSYSVALDGDVFENMSRVMFEVPNIGGAHLEAAPNALLAIEARMRQETRVLIVDAGYSPSMVFRGLPIVSRETFPQPIETTT